MFFFLCFILEFTSSNAIYGYGTGSQYTPPDIKNINFSVVKHTGGVVDAKDSVWATIDGSNLLFRTYPPSADTNLKTK